jgi:hypothetical protein
MRLTGEIEIVRNGLVWCAVTNYGILLVWFLFFTLGHDWMYQFHGRWFHFSVEQFDMLHYAGMSIFKIGIILFESGPVHCPVDLVAEEPDRLEQNLA